MNWLPLFLWWMEEEKTKDKYIDDFYPLMSSDWTIKDKLFILIPILLIIIVDILGFLWAFGYIKF